MRLLRRGALTEPLLEGVDDRCAAARLHRNQPRQVAGDPAEFMQFAQRLEDRDDADTATRRVEDHIRTAPTQLLGDLEPHRLLALYPIRLLQRRGVLIALASGHSVADEGGSIADEAVYQV